jgi:MFS family permease
MQRASLPLLCLSRAGTCIAAMAYAGALPFLRGAWGMDAATAGSVQSAYNICVAVALLVGSWAAGRVGAKRVFLASSWAAVLAAVLMAGFARSHDSALLLMALVGITQGGAYTPALMLVAEMVSPARRGAAMGALLASGSFGYLLSVSGSLGGAALLDYRWGFALCAVGPVAGAVAGTLALRSHPNLAHARHAGPGDGGMLMALVAPVSLLLTVGYIAHTWELLGLWAWLPAFLAASLSGLGLGAVGLGVVVAAAVHLAGVVATLVTGVASDRWGRRTVLIASAAASGVLSAAVGWSATWSPVAVLVLACAASFAAYGDSGVLSTAMTESVPPRHLGSVLAIRSILGFGAGAVSPVVFGAALDATGQWGWPFTVLAAGGLVAVAAACALPRTRAG